MPGRTFHDANSRVLRRSKKDGRFSIRTVLHYVSPSPEFANKFFNDTPSKPSTPRALTSLERLPGPAPIFLPHLNARSSSSAWPSLRLSSENVCPTGPLVGVGVGPHF